MGQVNVNTPGGGTAGEPAGSSGAGFILGIIVAIIVIAVLVYFFVLAPGGDSNGGDRPDRQRGVEPGAERRRSCGTTPDLSERPIHTTPRPRAGASACASDFLTLGSLSATLLLALSSVECQSTGRIGQGWRSREEAHPHQSASACASQGGTTHT